MEILVTSKSENSNFHEIPENLTQPVVSELTKMKYEAFDPRKFMPIRLRPNDKRTF